MKKAPKPPTLEDQRLAKKALKALRKINKSRAKTEPLTLVYHDSEVVLVLPAEAVIHLETILEYMSEGIAFEIVGIEKVDE